jgi:hypothetical protein
VTTRTQTMVAALAVSVLAVVAALVVSLGGAPPPRDGGVTLPDATAPPPDPTAPPEEPSRATCRPLGCERWHVALPAERVSVHDGLAVVVGRDRLTAIEAYTGHLRWQRDLPEPWGTPPATPVEVFAAGDGAIVVQGAGRLELRSTEAGLARWMYDLRGRHASDIVVRDGLLILTGRLLDAPPELETGFVGGWTIDSGSRRWEVELDADTDAVVLEDVVVVRRSDALELLDPATGQLTAVIATQGRAAVAQAGPWLVVVGDDGAWLHHPDDGAMVTLEHPPVAAAGLEDGVVLAAESDDATSPRRIVVFRLAEDTSTRWSTWLADDWSANLHLQLLPGGDRLRLTDADDPLRSTDIALATGWVLDHRRIEPLMSEGVVRLHDLTTGEEQELRFTPDFDVRVEGPLTIQRSDDVDVLRIEGPAGAIDVEGGRELVTSTPLVVWTEDGLMGLAPELVGIEP